MVCQVMSPISLVSYTRVLAPRILGAALTVKLTELGFRDIESREAAQGPTSELVAEAVITLDTRRKI